MATALTPGEPWEYVTKADRELKEDDPNRTVWTLRTLSGRQHQDLDDSLGTVGKDQELRIRVGTHKRRAVELGLIGVRNFRDSKGKEIEFRYHPGPKDIVETVHREFLERIRPKDLHELAEAIVEHETLEARDEKNSS